MLRVAVASALVLALFTGCDPGPTEPPAADAGGACTTDLECSDGMSCNGTERCAPDSADADARGCVPDPTSPCLEGQRCDAMLDRCVTDCAVTEDADGDGADAMECGGSDCDDADDDRHPGNPEICDVADVDEDCDPLTFGVRDQDMDGEADARCCNEEPDGTRHCGRDCDDTSANIQPGQDESCNELDDDCDGATDEDVLVTYYPDADGDGFGDAEGAAVEACEAPDDHSQQTGDCDDAVPASNPAAPEICDAVDNDCDGFTDEGSGAAYFVDADGDGFGDAAAGPMRFCSRPDGHVEIGGDCDDTSAASNPGATEVCDGIDNNCSGAADEGLVLPLYPDADRDGAGDASVAATTRCPAEGWVTGGTDCNDASPAVRPGLSEICDGLDNDCSGGIDDGLLVRLYPDRDGDGDGDRSATGMMRCPAPGFSTRNTDCDDGTFTTYGGAVELCDSADNDCDTRVDESVTVSPWYVDADRDGFGNPRLPAMLSCTPIAGRSLVTECDDNRADVYPGAPQLCDGVDNTCSTDDGSGNAVARPAEDVDGDRHSAPAAACTGGFPKDDCVDTNATIYTGAPERCDRLDNDCSSGGGLVANEDADQDGHARTSHACRGGFPNDDCDDTRADTYTGAPERCDGRDNDCSSGGGALATEDADGDGHSPAAAACTGGYPKDDCLDSNASVYTGAPEICDRIDNDCSAGGGAVPAEDADMDGFGAPTAPCPAGPRSDCDDTMAARAACMPNVASLSSSADYLVAGDLYGTASEELWSVEPSQVWGVTSGSAPVMLRAGITGASAAARGDFDGDGELEIVVLDNAANTVAWYEDLDDTAHPIGTTSSDASDPWRTYFVIANLNADGYDDVVLVRQTAIGAYLSNGTGGYAAYRAINISSAAINVWQSGLAGVAAADMRGRGYDDLVVAWHSEDRINGGYDHELDIVQNNGTGTTWTWGTEIQGIDGSYDGWVSVGDVDGDGDFDVVHSNTGNGTTLHRNGGGTWARTVLGPQRGRAILVDLDQDGDLDVVAGDARRSTAQDVIWHSNADGVGSSWHAYLLSSRSADWTDDFVATDVAASDGFGVWRLALGGGGVRWLELSGGRFSEIDAPCSCWVRR